MPSGFGWVDFVEEDRQRMLDVIQLFREQETVDELGIGTIRDGFADYFFPGTSTIQTRARYMLFISWIYLSLERKRVPSAQIAKKARSEEIKLIYALLDSGEIEGVIGRIAKDGLVRLPSNIYWNGLWSWGIRLFPGTQDEYHRDIDRYYKRISQPCSEGDEDTDIGSVQTNWHPGLPAPPDNFPEHIKFALTKDEARYLQERILQRHPDSLLAILVREPEHFSKKFIWEHSIFVSLSNLLKVEISHAQNFSDTIYGAALLYNLMLSELLNQSGWITDYQNKLNKWVGELSARWSQLNIWYNDLKTFWSCSALSRARISYLTKKFVEDWLKIIFEESSVQKVSGSQSARKLIYDREIQLKHNRARLENTRARGLWRGASGANKLDFRWGNASWILQDVIKGLTGKGENNA
jgi:hypothetical protein